MIILTIMIDWEYEWVFSQAFWILWAVPEGLWPKDTTIRTEMHAVWYKHTRNPFFQNHSECTGGNGHSILHVGFLFCKLWWKLNGQYLVRVLFVDLWLGGGGFCLGSSTLGAFNYDWASERHGSEFNLLIGNLLFIIIQ